MPVYLDCLEGLVPYYGEYGVERTGWIDMPEGTPRQAAMWRAPRPMGRGHPRAEPVVLTQRRLGIRIAGGSVTVTHKEVSGSVHAGGTAVER